MADTLTTEERSERMRLIRGNNTKPELIVRKLVFTMGYRYRLHHRKLPGKPDLAFPGRRRVIFVHGCFWHGHACKQGRRMPKSNVKFWTDKLGQNKKRDTKNRLALRRLGWKVLVVWQCQIKDIEKVEHRIAAFFDD